MCSIYTRIKGAHKKRDFGHKSYKRYLFGSFEALFGLFLAFSENKSITNMNIIN